MKTRAAVALKCFFFQQEMQNESDESSRCPRIQYTVDY